MGPQALRMNLNTLLRHGVAGRCRRWWTSSPAGLPTPRKSVARVSSRTSISSAYLNAEDALPQKIKAALLPGGRDRLRQHAGAAGSGGYRSGRVGFDAARRSRASAAAGRRARCAAWTWRRCSRRRSCAATRTAWSFRSTTRRIDVKLDAQDTILSLAERLAKYGGGGTNCSLPLAEANSATATDGSRAACW